MEEPDLAIVRKCSMPNFLPIVRQIDQNTFFEMPQIKSQSLRIEFKENLKVQNLHESTLLF